MSQAKMNFPELEAPLDVRMVADAICHAFGIEFRKACDYAGVKTLRYPPDFDLREAVINILTRYDGMRSQHIKFLKEQYADLLSVTPTRTAVKF